MAQFFHSSAQTCQPLRFDLVPPFELPFDLAAPPIDPSGSGAVPYDEDVIVDASNMNFMHVPAEAFV